MSNLAKLIDRKKNSFLITKRFLQIKLNQNIKTLISQESIKDLYDLTKEQLSLLNKDHQELFFKRLIEEFKQQQSEEKKRITIDANVMQSIVKIGDTSYLERYLHAICGDKHYTMHNLLELSKIMEKTNNKDNISEFYRQIQPLIFNYDENIKKSNLEHPLFIHNPLLNIKPEAHEHSEAREEYARHNLIFNSLEYLNQDTIINQWEDLSLLTYTIREHGLYGAKSELFWMLNVPERFPEVYDKILNSEENRYLLCSTSYTENIAESPQNILFMHYDFKDIHKALRYAKDLNALYVIKQSQENYEKRNRFDSEDETYYQYEMIMLRNMNKNIEKSEMPNFIAAMIETTIAHDKNFANYIPVDNILEKNDMQLDCNFFIDSIKLFENEKLNLPDRETNIRNILKQWGQHLSLEALDPLLHYFKKYNYSMNEAFSEKGIALADGNFSRKEKKHIAETIYAHTHNFQFIAQLVKYGKSKTMNTLSEAEINEHFNSIISVNIELALKYKCFPRNRFLHGVLDAISYYENKNTQITFLHNVINEFEIDPKITHIYLKNLIKIRPETQAFSEVDSEIQKNYLNNYVSSKDKKQVLRNRI